MHPALTAGSVLVPVAYAVLFVLLLAPGYAVARVMVRRFAFERSATLAIAYAVVAVAGYAVFWCYFLKPELGRFVSAVWLLAAFVALYALRRVRIPRDELMPLAVTFLVGLFYLAVLYLPGIQIGASQRFFVLRPQDNIIPQLFAEHLFQGADLRHFLGDWQSSDRPPLQTAILLLVRPAFPYLGVGAGICYEIAGVVTQLVWTPAAWLLCVRARFSPRHRAIVLAFMVFSGFFLYNTVYTWPKLLAAGMCIAALLFAVVTPVATPAKAAGPRARRDAGLVIAGACAALALLAHGSAVFFLVPALLLALVFRRLPFARGLAWGAAAGVVLLLPWAAYQRYYDPPGDRLLKMHLAGINDVAPRPAAIAIRDAYASAPLGEIVRYKVANVQTALGAAPLLGSASEGEPVNAVNVWRLHEREQVTTALGALNLGWLALAWRFVTWRFRRRSGDAFPLQSVAALLLIAFVSIALWCVVMWGPGMTVTTHSSYAVEAVLFVALAATVAALPRPLPGIVLALAVADLAVTWIVGSLGDAWRVTPSLDPLMAVLALAAAAAAGALLRLDARGHIEDVRGAGALHSDEVAARAARAPEEPARTG